MKLWNVLKVFGAATVIAGLTPYRVTKDEETGTRKVRALFWEATSTPKTEDEEKNVSVNVGFFSPLEKDDDEAHLFADELTVEYSMMDGEGEAAPVESGAEEDTAEEPAEEAAAEESPAEEPAEAEESEKPEEEAAE